MATSGNNQETNTSLPRQALGKDKKYSKLQAPSIDTSICTHCGLCIQDCVSNAINPATMEIHDSSCIRCSHCSAICPVHAVLWPGSQEGAESVQKIPENFPKEFENLIRARRSIRHFTNQELPADVIQNILDITNYAPTGTNSRGVGITVVQGKEKMGELSDITMGFFRLLARILLNPLTKPFLLVFLGLKRLGQLESYKAYIDRYYQGENFLTHGAHAVFLFHAHRKSSCPSEDGVIWATTAALYAESLGLGTCYNGFLVRACGLSPRVRSFLQLPRGHRVYETFLVGYPKFKYQRAAEQGQCYSRVIG